jgi:hypothetical protein
MIRSRKPRLTAVGIRYADYPTPSIPKKVALSPTSGGRSVGIVRLQTKSHGVLIRNENIKKQPEMLSLGGKKLYTSIKLGKLCAIVAVHRCVTIKAVI